MADGTTFADIAAAGGPMEQWQMVPEVGKLQILGASKRLHRRAACTRQRTQRLQLAHELLLSLMLL